MLFWNLGETYLWQDEAATAVLADRMIKFGRPLAYDGTNFVSVDAFSEKDAAPIAQRTANPRAAVDYFVQKGDYLPDTAWRFQPWGQFLAAAAGLLTVGHTTLGARLPFSLAAFAAIPLLYWLVRKYFGSARMALLAASLLVLNSYWILHSRQSRYYALSSLLLVLTLAAYARWQWGGRWGAAAFVAAAWCWFNVDYGTVVPLLVVLFIDAIAANRRNLPKTLAVWTALAALLAPAAYFYGLWGGRLQARISEQSGTWFDRWSGNLINMNAYVLPVIAVSAAIVLLAKRGKTLPEPERRLIGILCGLYAGLTFWIPTVAPFPFLRYVIILAPAGSLLAAWLLVRGLETRPPYWAALGALLLALTPCFSLPLRLIFPTPPGRETGVIFRSELTTLGSHVFGHRPDPNRAVVEWLKANAAPTDEILINYEDVPLMFYLPNPIRGGIAAFRAEDDAKSPPRFAVVRRSAGFVHWPIFRREIERYKWTPVPLKAPDIAWGNIPDPIAESLDPAQTPNLLLLRRDTNALISFP